VVETWDLGLGLEIGALRITKDEFMNDDLSNYNWSAGTGLDAR